MTIQRIIQAHAHSGGGGGHTSTPSLPPAATSAPDIESMSGGELPELNLDVGGKERAAAEERGGEEVEDEEADEEMDT